MDLRFFAALTISMAFGLPVIAQVKYFPPGALSSRKQSDQFLCEWYTKQLQALDEPSIWELSKTQNTQTYRLLWLRTFHHPVVIRVEIYANGTSQRTTKMTSGAGGYAPGDMIQNDVATLTKDQTDKFLGIIDANNFWDLPSFDESRIGLDGAQWIIEGARKGTYHIVDRWSPENGAVRTIGLSMIKELAKLKVPSKEVY
jgi:hypothetical protein